MNCAVIIFPGSNCDRDMAVALQQVTGQAPKLIWHGETDLPSGLDLIAIPGGFSYGDYLRSGAIAARSNIIRSVQQAAARGVKILGVCNGFQILTETGLLPGALMRNAKLRFVCRSTRLQLATTDASYKNVIDGKELNIPVAHHDGNYFASDEDLARLADQDRIVFRYAENINGSRDSIAAVVNEQRNVLGMMPHPERAIADHHPSSDGRHIFQALLS